MQIPSITLLKKMVGLTLVYEDFGSLPKLQTVHRLHNLRFRCNWGCRMSQQQQDYDTSSTCTIHTVVLVLSQYQLLFVCLSATELKVFHFLISKLCQRPHPSGCCNEKCKHYIVTDHNSCHYDTVKYYYKTHSIKISWSDQIPCYIITTQRIAFFDWPSLQPCRDSFIFCNTQ